jgi:hypothetical protein
MPRLEDEADSYRLKLKNDLEMETPEVRRAAWLGPDLSAKVS